MMEMWSDLSVFSNNVLTTYDSALAPERIKEKLIRLHIAIPNKYCICPSVHPSRFRKIIYKSPEANRYETYYTALSALINALTCLGVFFWGGQSQVPC